MGTLEDNAPLAGKVAVVTGGSSGIGASCVRRFAAAGARVAIGFNTGADRAKALIPELPGQGHLAIHLPMEDSAAIRAAASAVREALGRADILVNSAGFTRMVPHADLDALDDGLIDSILVSNVRGPFATIRAFAPLLRAGGESVIVNISSIAATSGAGSNVIYGASKAALDTMSMSLARVLGPEIRVVCVSPGMVDTGFVPGRDRAAVEKASAATPLKRVVGPDDVALAVMAAVTHLKLTTGSILTIDGGRHL